MFTLETYKKSQMEITFHILFLISFIYVYRAQIMVYRLLARNQPVPQQVALAAQGKLLRYFNVNLYVPGDYSIFCIACCHVKLFCLLLVELSYIFLFYTY